MKIQGQPPASGRQAAVSLLLVLGLLVILAVPLCATEACPMGEHAEQAGCDPLDGGCCQTQGTQTADAPLQILPPVAAACPPYAGEGDRSVPPVNLPEALALPAVLQGIGLHAFFEIFLI